MKSPTKTKPETIRVGLDLDVPSWERMKRMQIQTRESAAQIMRRALDAELKRHFSEVPKK